MLSWLSQNLATILITLLLVAIVAAIIIRPLKETVRGFKEILEGKYDDLPENAFYMVGTIDEAVEKARKIKEEEG